ncbi:hypothetical protein JTB14_010829 [Gonioctena quinquepunctata]|nr:hypothetical protein JTB14_010829 [Gonioctena quinquepunctata]
MCFNCIFGLIFVFIAVQISASSADISSTAKDVSTQPSTTIQEAFSAITKAPAIFPSNETAGKPIISLNYTVDKPNLDRIKNENSIQDIYNELPVSNSTEGSLVTVESNIITTNKSHEEQALNIIDAENTSQPVDIEVAGLLEESSSIPEDLEPVSPKINYKPDQKVDLSVILFDKALVAEGDPKLKYTVENSNSKENVGLIQGQLAAFLAGVFLIVSIFGYVALLSWRRFLE